MISLCETCEEREKLDDQFCTLCHLKHIQYNYSTETNYIDLYKLALWKKKQDIPIEEVFIINKLQNQILSILKNLTLTQHPLNV